MGFSFRPVCGPVKLREKLQYSSFFSRHFWGLTPRFGVSETVFWMGLLHDGRTSHTGLGPFKAGGQIQTLKTKVQLVFLL